MNKTLTRFVVDGILVLLLIGLFALPVGSFAILGVNSGYDSSGVLSVQDERPIYSGELELLEKEKVNEIVRTILGMDPEVSSTSSVRR